jgi:c-di-GMP-binding flagellar brake protein YcgR
MEEKRKYIRIEAPIVVTYKLSGKKPVTKKTITKNFSEGGIRFPVYEKLNVGAPLELYIETPFDTIPISAAGQIVWTKALSTEEGREIYDVGVKFTKMQTFEKKRMAQTTKHFLSMGRKYRSG